MLGGRLLLLTMLSLGSIAACGEVLAVDADDPPRTPPSTSEAGTETSTPLPGIGDGEAGAAADPCQRLGCASGRCSAGKCEPLIFVTMQLFDGAELGGNGGDPGFAADKACREEGKLFSATSTFFGWIAGTGGGPVTRGLRLVPRFHWTPAPDGGLELVSQSATALGQNLLVHVIQRRDGSTAPSPVRTNVRADGTTLATAVQESCDTWRSNLPSSLGAVGVSASLMPSVWAAHLQSGSYLVAACDAALPLYCVEDTTP